MTVPVLKSGLKLGKLPARPHAKKLAFSDYVDRARLPAIPASFGHDSLIGAGSWGMLANDAIGDCVIAMQMHAVMLWNRVAGRTVTFDGKTATSDYSAITGYDPHARPDANGDNPTDGGTDMGDAATYFRRTGMLDTAGKRHRIVAELSLRPGVLEDVWAAAYLGAATGVGVQLPLSATDQFDAGQPWTFVRGSEIVGGHAILLSGKRGNTLDFITWGRRQTASVYWYERYADEAVAFISEEFLTGDKSPEGFDIASLEADLSALHAA